MREHRARPYKYGEGAGNGTGSEKPGLQVTAPDMDSPGSAPASMVSKELKAEPAPPNLVALRDATSGRFVVDASVKMTVPASRRLTPEEHVNCVEKPIVFHLESSTEQNYFSDSPLRTSSRSVVTVKREGERALRIETRADGENTRAVIKRFSESGATETPVEDLRGGNSAENDSADGADYECIDNGGKLAESTETGRFALEGGTLMEVARTVRSFKGQVFCIREDGPEPRTRLFQDASILEVSVYTSRSGLSSDPCLPGVLVLQHKEVRGRSGRLFESSHFEELPSGRRTRPNAKFSPFLRQ